MPLPNDERVVALANDLLQAFDQLFGVHPGFRAAHAKGLMLEGTFTPAAGATALTRAPHITRPFTPVTVRFSNSTGIPEIPDNVGDANPRGIAIRFNLAEHVHTDIVAHSTDGFPTRDGYEFLEFLRAVAASGPDVPSPKPVEKFLGSHPAALAFVQAPKPFPTSFATETYFGVTAFEFTNQAGEKKFGRYRIIPEAGNSYFRPSRWPGSRRIITSTKSPRAWPKRPVGIPDLRAGGGRRRHGGRRNRALAGIAPAGGVGNARTDRRSAGLACRSRSTSSSTPSRAWTASRLPRIRCSNCGRQFT